MRPIHIFTGGLFRTEGEHLGPDCLGEHDNPYVLAMQFPFDTIVEWCAECEAEVLIPAFGVSRCPECGARILPCSMCGEVGDDGLVSMRCWDDCPYYIHEEAQCSLR